MAELQVGRDMDEAVARAIGLVPCQADFHIPGHPHYSAEPCYAKPDNPGQGREVRYYSTSDADVLAAVDVVLAKHKTMMFELEYLLPDKYDPSGWVAAFYEAGRVHSYAREYANTRAEAISRAIIALGEQDKG